MAQMKADHVAIEKFATKVKKLSEDLLNCKKEADSKINELGNTYRDDTFKDFKGKYDEGMKIVLRMNKELMEHSQYLLKLKAKVQKHLDIKFKK